MTKTIKQEWQLQEAKARFSELFRRARTEGPQYVTRNGKEAVVVLQAEEWERRTERKGTLMEFFAASPLRGSGLKIRRSKELPRKIVL